VRTNRLFALAVVTALVGLAPWLTAVPLAIKLLGVALTLVSLLVAYLTGSVLITQRGKGTSGCGACETCSCSSGASAASI
jgi:heme A synthase